MSSRQTHAAAGGLIAVLLPMSCIGGHDESWCYANEGDLPEGSYVVTRDGASGLENANIVVHGGTMTITYLTPEGESVSVVYEIERDW